VLDKFWWKRIRHDVQEFCELCVVCRRAKIQPRMVATLYPLPLPLKPWHTRGLDYLAHLLVSNSIGNMLIVVQSDRDPKFVSGFWETLFIPLGTPLNMSSGRHQETDGLTERVNGTFAFFCYYDGSKWTCMLPQVQFAYNATRALGIEHTPFEANFDFSREEPHVVLFSMRPSILVCETRQSV
jgi:hypothetical protein